MNPLRTHQGICVRACPPACTSLPPVRPYVPVAPSPAGDSQFNSPRGPVPDMQGPAAGNPVTPSSAPQCCIQRSNALRLPFDHLAHLPLDSLQSLTLAATTSRVQPPLHAVHPVHELRHRHTDLLVHNIRRRPACCSLCLQDTRLECLVPSWLTDACPHLTHLCLEGAQLTLLPSHRAAYPTLTHLTLCSAACAPDGGHARLMRHAEVMMGKPT